LLTIHAMVFLRLCFSLKIKILEIIIEVFAIQTITINHPHGIFYGGNLSFINNTATSNYGINT